MVVDLLKNEKQKQLANQTNNTTETTLTIITLDHGHVALEAHSLLMFQYWVGFCFQVNYI